MVDRPIAELGLPAKAIPLLSTRGVRTYRDFALEFDAPEKQELLARVLGVPVGDIRELVRRASSHVTLDDIDVARRLIEASQNHGLGALPPHDGKEQPND